MTALASEMALTPAHLSLGNGSSECIRAILQAQAIAAQRRGRAVQLVVPDPPLTTQSCVCSRWVSRW